MYIAIDIGGTKTEIAFFDGKDLSSLKRSKSIPTSQDYATGRNAIFDTVQELLGDSSVQSIHVSFPGLLRGTEILQSSNIPDYFDRPLKQQLEERFHVPVSILQDSICSAIAELVYGDIGRYKRVAYLIMGTGIGGAFVRQTESGTTVSPLETGGMVVNLRDGRSHDLTQTAGILEAYVGGGNVEQFYRKKLSEVADDDVIWSEITDFLAAGINNINVLLMPDVVVVGGGIGLKRQAALKQVIDKVKPYKEFVVPPKIEFTKIDGNSSLIGALASNFIDNLVID